MPIIYPLGSDSDFRLFQERSFQVMLMGILSFFVNNIWLSLLMVYTLFLDYLNGTEPTAQKAILNLFLGIMLFGVSRNLFKCYGVKAILRYLLWPAIISMVFMLFQLAAIDPYNAFPI